MTIINGVQKHSFHIHRVDHTHPARSVNSQPHRPIGSAASRTMLMEVQGAHKEAPDPRKTATPQNGVLIEPHAGRCLSVNSATSSSVKTCLARIHTFRAQHNVKMRKAKAKPRRLATFVRKQVGINVSFFQRLAVSCCKIANIGSAGSQA